MNEQMQIKEAVILAGGMSSRIRRKKRDALKVMLPIGGKSLLERNVEILRDQLNIHSIKMVVGYKKHVIEEHFRDGRNYGVEIEYLESDPHKGTADALLLAKNKVNGTFIVLLGDEFYLNTNHFMIKMAKYPNADAIVMYIRSNNPQDIARNYSIKLREDGKVAEIVEKPTNVENDLLGVGTFVFTDRIFQYISGVEKNMRSKKRELLDAVSILAEKHCVYAYELKGEYVNINTIDDWYYASYLFNQSIFKSFKKSLIIPTLNEAESILFVLNDFKDEVDEIIVVDGGSTDGTIEKVAGMKGPCNVKIVQGKFRGYGDAIRNGIKSVEGEIIVLVEGDATFRSRDIHKMYEYIKDCDMVIGTRTTKQLICQGANMKFLLRLGNVIAGKIIELLWIKNEPRFTDVGCTYRVFWKSVYDEIKHNIVSHGPEFSPEMMIEFIKANKRAIEIPVSYYKRIGGASKHSKSMWGVFKTAVRMFSLVIKKVMPLKGRRVRIKAEK